MLSQWHREFLILLTSLILFYKPMLADDEWELSQTNTLSVKGADPLILTNSRDTLLHIAAEPGQSDAIPMATNAQNFGETLIFRAVRSRSVEAIECALNVDRDMQKWAYYKWTNIGNIINAKNQYGETPMIVAANLQYWDIVQFFLKKGADPMISTTMSGDNVLHIASKYGQIDAIDNICQKISTANGETLIFKIRSKLVAVVKYFWKFIAGVHEEADGSARFIDAQNANGQTPLMMAANFNQWDTVQFLLEKGADPLISTTSGVTPLHIAIKYGQIDAIDVICQKFPTAINAKDSYGETPIFYAVRSKLVAVVECVLKYLPAVHEEADGFDLNEPNAADQKATHIDNIIDAKNRNGETPMIVAANLQYWDIVQFLLKKGADPMISTTTSEVTPFHIAIKYGQIDAIEIICQKFPTAIISVDSYGETPIFHAVRSNLVAVVECVLKHIAHVHEEADGPDSNSRNAADQKSTHIAHIINAKNEHGMTPMILAAHLQYWDIVQFLVDKVADPMISTTTSYQTPLHFATYHGQIDTMNIICQKFPTAINAVIGNGETVLFHAVRSNLLEVVECAFKYLVAVHEEADDPDSNSRNASDKKSTDIAHIIDTKNQFGNTPMIVAAHLQYWDIVQFLLQKGADPMIPISINGDTLLHFATANGQIALIPIICKLAPSAIHAVNAEQETPIFGAVRSRLKEVVESVLKCGHVVAERADSSDSNIQNIADHKSWNIAGTIDVQNQNGETPIFVAVGLEDLEMVSYLLSLGADPTISTMSGLSPLHLAATTGQVGVIDAICQDVGVCSMAINCMDRYGDTPLILAMRSKQQLATEALLDRNAGKTVRDEYGRTTLHYAAENRWVGIAEKLFLSVGPNYVNAQDDFERTPLFLAVSMHVHLPDTQTNPMVQFLLQNGADQTIRDNFNNTPLEIACVFHMVEMVELLVKFANPVIINAKNPQEKTCLHRVLENSPFYDTKIVKIVEILIENGADPTIPDTNLDTAFHYAAEHSFAKNAEIILNWAKRSGKSIIDSPNREGKTALHLAVDSTSDTQTIPMVQVLLQNGADQTIRDNFNNTPLEIAAVFHMVEMVKLLVKFANPVIINAKNSQGKISLHRVLEKSPFHDQLVTKYGIETLFLCSVKIVEILIENGADPAIPDNNLDTALHYAAHYSCAKNTEIILDWAKRSKKSIIDAPNREGKTALHRVLEKSPFHDPEIVKTVEILIENGADPTIPDNNLDTALHYAAQYSCTAKNAEMILDWATRSKKSIIDSPNREGKTALHLAVDSKSDTQTIPLVQVLLQNGADQTIRDNFNNTPLEIAAVFHMVEMVKLLVKFANPVIINANNSQGKTSLHRVLEKSKPFHAPKIVKIVEILIGNGADPAIPDKNLDTALHYAAQYSFARNAEIILNWAKRSGNSIIDSPNREGKTALHLAVDSTAHLGDDLRVDMISVLLNYGANRSIGDNLEETPLHYAAQINSIVITELLLEDADSSYINLQDLDLQTPLHLAVKSRFEDAKIDQMVQYLLSKGADLSIRDINGLSPLDVAKRLGLKNTVQTLLIATVHARFYAFRKFP